MDGLAKLRDVTLSTARELDAQLARRAKDLGDRAVGAAHGVRQCRDIAQLFFLPIPIYPKRFFITSNINVMYYIYIISSGSQMVATSTAREIKKRFYP